MVLSLQTRQQSHLQLGQLLVQPANVKTISSTFTSRSSLNSEKITSFIQHQQQLNLSLDQQKALVTQLLKSHRNLVLSSNSWTILTKSSIVETQVTCQGETWYLERRTPMEVLIDHSMELSWNLGLMILGFVRQVLPRLIHHLIKAFFLTRINKSVAFFKQPLFLISKPSVLRSLHLPSLINWMILTYLVSMETQMSTSLKTGEMWSIMSHELELTMTTISHALTQIKWRSRFCTQVLDS